MIIALFIALAVASVTPHHPQWPADFSSTVAIHETGKGFPQFSRWFYSSAAQIDRIDGLAMWEGEFYFAEQFFNHNTHRVYAVFYQRDSSAFCIDTALTNPFPKPDFNNFTYAGEALIDYVPVYHWIYRAGNDFFQFFDSVASRQPVRFDAEFGERPALQINYMEFDSGSQDAAIFQIPSEVSLFYNFFLFFF
jgi:hypothetical protein